MSGLTRPRRRAVVLSACLAGVLVAGLGTWAVVDVRATASATGSGAGDGSTAPADGQATAPVEKGDLSDSKVFAGTLGYGASTGVPGVAEGTVTWLPAPGDVIGRDQALYAVDERPVRAMHGRIPLWRTLAFGSKGDDVQQLNENLAALGYGVSVDRVFGKRTLAAVKQWQKDRGRTVTGELTKDDIAFVDGDVRVASVSGALGQPAGGDVISVTSTSRVVTASVPQRDAERLAVGTEVRVRINGAGDAMDGKVVDASPGESKDSGEVVDVTISFDQGDRDLPSAAAAQIDAVGRTEQDVLSVPVAALLAGTGKGSGFAVDVRRRDGSTKRIQVDVGFVAEGRAAVTGNLHEGDLVVVPS